MSLDPAERFARLRLARTDRIGPVAFTQLIGRYGSALGALDALPDLVRKSGAASVPPPVETVEREMAAGEAANMAKYAAAEAACDAVDRAVQTHGGNGISQEYGMAGLLVAARAGRIAPVSREMVLNFVAMHSLGLPKSY